MRLCEKHFHNWRVKFMISPATLKKGRMLSKKRYSICKSCSSFSNLTKMCRECNCFMPAKTELVHQTEVSCSNGHDINYMKIREVYDTYGYKEQGRVVCELCGTTYMLSESTLEE